MKPAVRATEQGVLGVKLTVQEGKPGTLAVKSGVLELRKISGGKIRTQAVESATRTENQSSGGGTLTGTTEPELER